MADSNEVDGRWLGVIARSLAYLCLQDAVAKNPDDFKMVAAKVKFAQKLGLSEGDAAYVAGSSPKSVQVMRSQKKGAKRGQAKKRR